MFRIFTVICLQDYRVKLVTLGNQGGKDMMDPRERGDWMVSQDWGVQKEPKVTRVTQVNLDSQAGLDSQVVQEMTACLALELR